MYLKANSFMCLRGLVSMPLTGAWVADLAIDPSSSGADVPIEQDPLTVSVGEGGFTLQGTVRRVNNAFDTVFARVVGGGGGLWRDVPARSYQGATFGLIAGNLLSQVGEKLSAATPSAISNIQLNFWSIQAGPAFVALYSLVQEAIVQTATQVNWRVLPDGSIFIGAESWPASPLASFDLMRWQPEQRMVTIFAENPNIVPGQLWQSANVCNVQHRIEPDEQRTKVWFLDA